MTRSKRELYASALDILLRGEMSTVVKARDWELLGEVARLAADDAPADLAATDPALFQTWRAAVTRFHLRGWTKMTPERVERLQIGKKLPVAENTSPPA